ncbi:hypothetical protein V8E36_000414 [Tilletia maclaganii]
MDERTPLLGESASPAARAPETHSNGQAAAVRSSTSSSSTLADIDRQLHSWKLAIAERFTRRDKGKARQIDPAAAAAQRPEPVALVSVFNKISVAAQDDNAPSSSSSSAAYAQPHNGHAHPHPDRYQDPGTSDDFEAQVEAVRRAIDQGLYPSMIQTGSSGSYFARKINADGKHETVAVFKPVSEEPYGTLNPKRKLLRRYFWWMMGRPCLVPNFAASSEAGASYLDARLNLHLVPLTRLASLSSPTFFYPYADREAWRLHKTRPPEKIGSFQLFLHNYTMASTFLRAHPWPTRPLELLEADLAAEQAAHKLSRRKQKHRVRTAAIALKRCLLCRTGPMPVDGMEQERRLGGGGGEVNGEGVGQRVGGDDDEGEADASARGRAREFRWTPATMRAFRIELEKLVVLDYLMRNTDRGLDNFMVHTSADPDDPCGSKDRKEHVKITLGAIDNSLSFPHRHPNGIRDYPFGWLWLPADLIGQPFSPETRNHFLPLLSDPIWWLDTIAGLRRIFEPDEHFSPKLFERQMAVMRGQGLNLVECLMVPSEGPIELCARPRKLVFEKVVHMTHEELEEVTQSSAQNTSVTLHHFEVEAAAPSPSPAANGVGSRETQPLGSVSVSVPKEGRGELDPVAERDSASDTEGSEHAGPSSSEARPIPTAASEAGGQKEGSAAGGGHTPAHAAPSRSASRTLSPDAAAAATHPRSMPMLDTDAVSLSPVSPPLARWQLAHAGSSGGGESGGYFDGDEAEHGHGHGHDGFSSLPLDRSMTGIEVLEREIAAAKAMQRRKWAPRRRLASEDVVAGVGSGAAEVDAEEVLSDDGEGGRRSQDGGGGGSGGLGTRRPLFSSRTRSNTTLSGAGAVLFRRFPPSLARKPSQPIAASASGARGAGAATATAEDDDAEGDGGRGRSARFPRHLARSSSEHQCLGSSSMDASVMSLPAAHRGPLAESVSDVGDEEPKVPHQARPGVHPRRVASGGGNGGAGAAADGGGGGAEVVLRPALRKRMGSMGGWSVTSLGGAGEGLGSGGGAGGGGKAGSREVGESGRAALSGGSQGREGVKGRDKVKVIVQRAVHDPSRAFLSWY